MTYSEKKEALEWDATIWGEALKFWRNQIRKYLILNEGPISILEIGSRSARLSYWINTTFPGNKIICTDRLWEEKNIYSKVRNLDTTNFILGTESVTELSFLTNSFDIVILKSVIGGLQQQERQIKAVEEIYRVLKPNGMFLFAENLKSTRVHRILRNRNKFPWNYLSYNEFKILLAPFGTIKYRTVGFIALFFQRLSCYRMVSYLDRPVSKLLPKDKRYVMYGLAIKN